MGGKAQATAEDWTGLTFGNNWIIVRKLNCAQYRAIYEEATGDTTKIIKNSHYLCHNKSCGISTYIERTVIQRAMRSGTNYLSKCKGCNGERKNCHYSIQCGDKPLTKVPDRTQKVEVGKTYGLWTVLAIQGSEASSDHQCRAECKCTLCGAVETIHFSTLLDGTACCECYKNHSSGEISVKSILDTFGIKYDTEYVFNDLVGINGGKLRYDFAILDSNNKLSSLIEYDGEQHFSEAGSYFNENGQVQIHDEIKNKYAKEHNIPLLRIPYYEYMNCKKLIKNFLHLN